MEYGINDWRNAILESDLPPNAKLVAIALANFYRDGRECYPSYTTLMEATSYRDKKTIIEAIKILVARKFIKIKKDNIRFSAQTNHYEFVGLSSGATSGSASGVTGGVTGGNIPPEIREEEKKEKDIIINNNIQKERFKAPTLDEVKTYIAEKNLIVDADKFFNYFTVGNWKDSLGKPVKNWKQKLITWDTKSRTERTLKAAKPLLAGVKSLTYGEDIPL